MKTICTVLLVLALVLTPVIGYSFYGDKHTQSGESVPPSIFPYQEAAGHDHDAVSYEEFDLYKFNAADNTIEVGQGGTHRLLYMGLSNMPQVLNTRDGEADGTYNPHTIMYDRTCGMVLSIWPGVMPAPLPIPALPRKGQKSKLGVD